MWYCTIYEYRVLQKFCMQHSSSYALMWPTFNCLRFVVWNFFGVNLPQRTHIPSYLWCLSDTLKNCQTGHYISTTVFVLHILSPYCISWLRKVANRISAPLMEDEISIFAFPLSKYEIMSTCLLFRTCSNMCCLFWKMLFKPQHVWDAIHPFRSIWEDRLFAKPFSHCTCKFLLHWRYHSQ